MESRKYKVIEKLLKVQEEATIYKLESILNNELTHDSWDILPDELKQALDAAVKQSENGQVKSHEEVMLEIKRKYNIA